MWVEQTKQGKYKYTERYKDVLTGKYKRVRSYWIKIQASTKTGSGGLTGAYKGIGG